MRKPRLVGFLIVMLLGVAAGLIYGWVISPASIANTSLDSLRGDYKADFVLMVAESYASDGDIARATGLLEDIQPSDPLTAVRDALVAAQQMGYSTGELQFIAELEKALKVSSVEVDTP